MSGVRFGRSRHAAQTVLRVAPHGAPRAARWAWAGVLLGALLALVLAAPARWLAAGLAQGTGARLVLAQTQGTVWSGSGQLSVRGGLDAPDATTLASRLVWRIRPGWDAQGPALMLHWQADCCMPQGWDWRLGWTGGALSLTLEDAHSQWPAGLLTGLGTPWNTVRLQGQLQLHTQALQLRWAAPRALLRGQAQVQALDVASSLSTLRPLGSYELTLQGGDGPSLQVHTLRGALQLQGQGQWLGGRLRFSGQARAAPEAEAALANLLGIIGRRQGAVSIIQLG
ncbi:MAG: hypothetical protein Fur007_18220 [Rhodoferax sp.]